MVHGIAHPLRLAIAFSLAKEGELPVWQIIELLKVSPELVSHHLEVMRKTGWVKRVRIGKRVTYSIIPRNLVEIHRLLLYT